MGKVSNNSLIMFLHNSWRWKSQLYLFSQMCFMVFVPPVCKFFWEIYILHIYLVFVLSGLSSRCTTVWKLRKFTLTNFSRKFCEINEFSNTNLHCKQLPRNIFQVSVNFSFFCTVCTKLLIASSFQYTSINFWHLLVRFSNLTKFPLRLQAFFDHETFSSWS